MKEVAASLDNKASIQTIEKEMQELGYNFKREGKDLYVRVRQDIVFKRNW